MKISSVSKKVLASALSAAMVVAFAPTVAFGAANTATADGTKTVVVTFDANGGTVTNGCAGFTTELLKDSDGKYFVKVAGTNAASITAYGANAGWFVDADGDGVFNTQTEKEVTEVPASSGDYYVEVAADTTAVVLKAYYTMPATSFASNAFLATDNYTNGSLISDNKAASLTVKIANTVTSPAGHTYVLTVTNPNGDVVGTKTFVTNPTGSQANVSSLVGNHTVFFTSNPATGDGMAAWKDKLVSGEYVATLTDNGKEISKSKVSLAKVTVKVGDTTESLFTQLVSGTATVDLDAINPLATPSVTYAAYVDANGYGVTDENGATSGYMTTVKGDATFTATKIDQVVSNVAYTPTAGKPGTISFDLAAGASKYAVTISDKDGVIFTGNYAAADGGNTQTLSFDTASAAAHVSAAEKAGEYVVTVVATDATTGDETTTKAKMTLTEIKYSVGEGVKFNDNSTAPSGDTTNWTKAAFQTQFTDAAVPVPSELIATVASAKTGYTLASEWQLNGKAYDANKNKLKAGETNTLTATATAQTLAAAPGYTVAKSTAGTTTEYVLTVTPAANTSVAVSDSIKGALGTITTAKAFVIDGKGDITFTVTSTDPSVGGRTVVLKTATNLVNTWNTATATGSSVLELLLGKTGAKWSSVAGIKAAIEAGKASYQALADKYYVSAEEIEDADLAAYKGLYEAIDAEANAQIASYKDGADVVAGTKVYYMTATVYADAVSKLAGEEKKLAKELKDAADKAAQITAYTKYATGASSLITTVNAELAKATENTTIKAADIAAAAAVTEQLKAAKTVAEAEAALAAYAALSADAKKFVATADVTAAEAIVAEAKAAEELKVAQDDAAVSKARSASKTVKAGKNGKTTKKQSVTLKKITSASGAKVTYKKSSGSSKVSVKSGKAYLAKGVKKGTYKATVKATCGTQTAKITVKFVVK